MLYCYNLSDHPTPFRKPARELEHGSALTKSADLRRGPCLGQCAGAANHRGSSTSATPPPRTRAGALVTTGPSPTDPAAPGRFPTGRGVPFGLAEAWAR